MGQKKIWRGSEAEILNWPGRSGDLAWNASTLPPFVRRNVRFRLKHCTAVTIQMTNLEKKIHPDVVAVSKSKATARALWMGQNLILLQWKSDKPPSFNTGIKESLCVLRPEKQRRRRAECHEKFSGTWSLSVEYVQKVSPS